MNARSKGCEEEVSGDTVSQVHINLPHAWYQQQPMIEDPPLRSILSILQCGRAIAALAVVGFHTRLGVEAFAGKMPTALSSLLSYGYLGVDFFFVLSGFIIYRTNVGKSAPAGWLRHFATSRLIRIFVPYLPIALCLGTLYIAFPGFSAADRDWDWFTTVTLFPGTGSSALNVAWTLSHELLFYSVFAIAVLYGQPTLAVATWICIDLLAFSIFPSTDLPILRVINIEFLFGMLAAKAVPLRRGGLTAAIAGSALCLAGMALGNSDPEDGARILFGAGAALLLLPLVTAEEKGTFRAPAILVLIGDASYALYLIHNPLVSLIVRVAWFNWFVATLACIGSVVALAVCYHRWFELPALRLANRLARGRHVDAQPNS